MENKKYDLVAQNTESTVVREYTAEYEIRARNYQSERIWKKNWKQERSNMNITEKNF